jgi:hypothetical protein
MFDARARDRLVADYRRRVYDVIGFVPLFHQAEWQCASEGWTLHDAEPLPGQSYMDISVADPADTTYLLDQRHQRLLTVPRLLTPRLGLGIVAHHLTSLTAFKGGKSYGLAAWATGFAVLPSAQVDFIGLEYATSEPEWEYLLEFLCSEPPHGMNLRFAHKMQDTRNGRMFLELTNGMTYVCKSWKQREQLKGRKKTAYIYTEAYQLPGMACYTSIRQNLRQLHGFAAWATTPDRPWVQFLHDQGHGANPDWHCTCGIKDSANPTTFDQAARNAADPDLGGVMTREKFAIAHDGTLGNFVGRVYNMARGQHLFTPVSHPSLWREDIRDAQP